MTDRTTAPGRGGRTGARPDPVVQTFRGPVAPAVLGTTLIHEHVFVGSTELDASHPHP